MWIGKSFVVANCFAIASALAHVDIFPSSQAHVQSDTGGASTLRLMFVGDSITHGHEADYTWRYRLWQWLRETETPFSFVGPYTGKVIMRPS